MSPQADARHPLTKTREDSRRVNISNSRERERERERKRSFMKVEGWIPIHEVVCDALKVISLVKTQRHKLSLTHPGTYQNSTANTK
jgi:hypothetical protein